MSQRQSDKKNPAHHQHYRNHLRQHHYNNIDLMEASTALINAESASTSRNAVQTAQRNPSTALLNAESTSQAPDPPSTTKDKRILRCFCGCSELTIEQIETFAMMNVNGLVNNSIGNNLLKTFLKIGHRTDKSNALLLLECYELCDKMLSNIESHRDHLDDLLELCPSFVWEQRLNDATDDEDQPNERVKEVLGELKKECLNSIECDNDFQRFRLELLRKIGK